MKLPKPLEHLKEKWEIGSNVDLFMIMLVFSLAGSAISFVRKPIFHALGITEHTPFWIKVLVYLPLIPPIYQINLLIFGAILGQFKFFWEKEKKIGRFLLRALSIRPKSST